MRTKIKNRLANLVASFWFLPTVMCVVAVASALMALRFDQRVVTTTTEPWKSWLQVDTPAGARSLLSAIAQSAIGLAGVVFSITILTLSFASSQFGPRLLRNFMRDHSGHFALGCFVSTYLYCLLVLRTVGSEPNDNHVPQLAVAVALALALANIGVLMFYIHHVARSIQVSSIIDTVGKDMDVLLREFFRPRESDPVARGQPETLPPPAEDGTPVESCSTGNIQAISLESLMELAEKQSLIIRLHVAPGDYVDAGILLASVHATDSRRTRSFTDDVQAAFVVGIERTNEQEIEYPIDQLVEIAVRALSPSLNDPFTAIHCIQRLGAFLALFAAKPWPSFVLRGQDGVPKIFSQPKTIDRLLHRAFDQILHYGANSPAVIDQVVKMLKQIESRAVDSHHEAVVRFAAHLRQLRPELASLENGVARST